MKAQLTVERIAQIAQNDLILETPHGQVSVPFADIQEIIRRHDANEPLGILRPVGRPLFPPTPRPLWELAVADQSLAHMKLSEKRRFTAAYNWMPVYEGITSDERAAWRQLQVLNHADKLTLQDWSTVREAFEHAVETHQIIAGSAKQWLAPFEALGGKTPVVSVRHAPPVEAFCTPMLAPRAALIK